MRSKIGILALALSALAGCATGDDGVNPRGGDGGRRDGGSDPSECVPACDVDQICRDGACVSTGEDSDEDGVPAAIDCDDADPAVGSTHELLCSSACGEGLEQCTDGVWTECSAPIVCDCAAGSAPREVPCERCGVQRQICTDGTWANDGACMSQGACEPGAMESLGACGSCGTATRRCGADCAWEPEVCNGGGECTRGAVESRSVACGACGEGTRLETRTCSDTCAWGAWGGGTCNTSATCAPGETDSESRPCMACGNQMRSRTCNATTCQWNAFGSWTTCPSCCGDGVCGGGESCASCADCRYGHLGTGSGGSSCAGVPAETWRCVFSTSFGAYVSQVCRSGAWVNFHLNPQNCNACVCSWSLACCQSDDLC